jgi:gliding motility-associated lipoprotein GldH
MKSKLIVFFCFTLLLASCGVKSPYYQKQHPVPGTQWAYKFQPVFKVEIKDTAARYDFYFLIRHDEAYPNSNIWFKLKIKAPGDTVFKDGPRIEKALADGEGKWLGTGMGGVWEHKIPLSRKEAPAFTKPGVYEIKMEQIMRNNPLPSVLNVGLNIEKK